MVISVSIAIIFAGFIIGFTSGITNEPAAGHITSGVTGFAAGILAVYKDGVDQDNLKNAAYYFIIYLSSVFIFYLIGNRFRVKGYLKCIWGKGK